MTDPHSPLHPQDIKADVLAAFQCQKTGNCCRVEGIVYASPQEIEQMARLLGIDRFTFMQKYVKEENGWLKIADRQFRPNCFLNDANQCQVYDARPHHCKTYPDWEYLWRDSETFLKELSVCKGLKLAYETVLAARGMSSSPNSDES